MDAGRAWPTPPSVSARSTLQSSAEAISEAMMQSQYFSARAQHGAFASLRDASPNLSVRAAPVPAFNMNSSDSSDDFRQHIRGLVPMAPYTQADAWEPSVVHTDLGSQQCMPEASGQSITAMPANCRLPRLSTTSHGTVLSPIEPASTVTSVQLPHSTPEGSGQPFTATPANCRLPRLSMTSHGTVLSPIEPASAVNSVQLPHPAWGAAVEHDMPPAETSPEPDLLAIIAEASAQIQAIESKRQREQLNVNFSRPVPPQPQSTGSEIVASNTNHEVIESLEQTGAALEVPTLADRVQVTAATAQATTHPQEEHGDGACMPPSSQQLGNTCLSAPSYVASTVNTTPVHAAPAFYPLAFQANLGLKDPCEGAAVPDKSEPQLSHPAVSVSVPSSESQLEQPEPAMLQSIVHEELLQRLDPGLEEAACGATSSGLPKNSNEPSHFITGSRVLALYHGQWFPGTVMQTAAEDVSGHGLWYVQCDEDQEGLWTQALELRPLEQPLEKIFEEPAAEPTPHASAEVFAATPVSPRAGSAVYQIGWEDQDDPELAVGPKTAGGLMMGVSAVLAFASGAGFAAACLAALGVPIAACAGAHLARLPAPSKDAPTLPTIHEQVDCRMSPTGVKEVYGQNTNYGVS